MASFSKSNVHTSHGPFRAPPSSQLPDGAKRGHNFLETTFFETNRHLPTPAQVKALSPNADTHPQAKPVVFEDLNLLVKFGPDIMRTVRQLEQNSAYPFIGSITHQRLLDYVFQLQSSAGPFTSIKAFNDWLSSLPQLQLPPELRYEYPV